MNGSGRRVSKRSRLVLTIICLIPWYSQLSQRARKIHDLGLQPKRPLLSLFSGSSKDQPGPTKGGKGTNTTRPIARRHTMPTPTRHASYTRPSGDAAKSGARPVRQSSSARPHHRPGASHRSSERPRAIEPRHSERPRIREPSRERPRAIEPPKRRATTGGTHAPHARPSQIVVATRTPVRQQDQRQPPPPSRRPSAKR